MDSVFGPIFDVIGWLLAQFYEVIPNLGIDITLLTILIMLVLYPLTSKQTRSMMAMQRVQPEIKKLQAKYKGDRQKLNEEMMKFYQENKINPLSGCLPLLVQMPILISLFNVLRNAYKYVPKSSSLYDAFCHGFGKLCGADVTSKLLSNHDPSLTKGFSSGDTLIHHLHFLSLDLQKSATAAHDGFLDTAPYFVLVVLVIITYMIQTRQAQKRTPAANKQMGALMKIMPPFFGLISIGLPSGVVIYLFFATAIGIFLGTIARSMPQLGLLYMLAAISMNMLSGSNTPLESMPPFLRTVMQASPSTHFVSFAQAILYRGAGFDVVWPQFLTVALIGGLFLSLALLRFRQTSSQA